MSEIIFRFLTLVDFDNSDVIHILQTLSPQETDLHNFGHHEPFTHHAPTAHAPAVDNEHIRPPPPPSLSPTITTTKTPPKKKRRRSYSKEGVKSGDENGGGGPAVVSSWQRLYYRVLAIESQVRRSIFLGIK